MTNESLEQMRSAVNEANKCLLFNGWHAQATGLTDALRALESTPAQVVPEGWALVPVKATTAQRLAMAKADGDDGDRYRNMAAALIAAAPTPPASLSARTAPAEGEPVAIVGERGSVSWRSDRILPIGTPLYAGAALAEGDGAQLRAPNYETHAPLVTQSGDRFAWSDERQGIICDGKWKLTVAEVVNEMNGRGVINRSTTTAPVVWDGLLTKLQGLVETWRERARGETERAKHHTVPARDAQAMNGFSAAIRRMADELENTYHTARTVSRGDETKPTAPRTQEEDLRMRREFYASMNMDFSGIDKDELAKSLLEKAPSVSRGESNG